ncbi:GNAT family N-acetyltransferase [Flammeovirga kamogawensis]|uniref:Acetyltransferase n=1 Tax=Flammeovirga kamogawensis TaxID=373891 RepID=A0ABX8H1S4_9BACT|nr:GNAT family N-acetyltransferase [Flammeovirga kamogawensis]MBB6463627.1 RimJ/RimL family protein N-acetyltransferase [Flammeovirga kamogawensis]QWG09849.1 acetyltransferase [Flammeovirga kamogawensis]TRX65356.1 acetyltransferase [Flammeovirga kamogawensis]
MKTLQQTLPFDTNFWETKAEESLYITKDIGVMSLVPFDLDNDIELLHSWVNLPYAKYWQLENSTVDLVYSTYKDIVENQNTCVFWGKVNNQKAFLVEFYYAPKDRVANYYTALSGDYGFHILTAPKKTSIPNFTTHIFSYVINFLFDSEEVNRIVVEPDVENEKIHILNKKAGFKYKKVIEFPEKNAYLAFCTRADFRSSAIHQLQTN